MRVANFGRTAAVILAALVATGVAQGPSTGPIERLAPAQVLTGFDVWAGTIQDLTLPSIGGAPFSVVVTLRGTPVTIDLRPHDVRARDFRLLVDDGQSIREIPAPPSVTFRGSVRGYSQSAVAASLVDGQLEATIHLEPGTVWGVQPISPVVPGYEPPSHIVYDGAHGNPGAHTCGVQGTVATNTQPGPQLDAVDKVAEIALEADYPFFQQNGNSTVATQNDMTAVVNAMEVIYQRDTGILYQITTMLVRTSPDPYTSNSPSTLLGQFRNWWNGNQGSVRRDVAHLFTGRNLSGTTIGIATLSVICNTGSAYGLSQSRYTNNFTFRVGLTAHELGHNWSARHCSGGTCRIMCAGLGGCSGSVTGFSSPSINSIVAHKNSRGCLSNAILPPTLSSVSPTSVVVFQPPVTTLRGTNLDTVTQVTMNGVPLARAAFTIISPTEIRFTPPTPVNLGLAVVAVSNPANVSNGLLFSYSKVLSPQLSVPAFAFGGQPLTVAYAGDPDDTFWLLASFGPKSTFKFQNYDILLNFGFLFLGRLDRLGLGSFTATVPPGVLNGITMNLQIVTFSNGNTQFAGASNIGSVAILF